MPRCTPRMYAVTYKGREASWNLLCHYPRQKQGRGSKNSQRKNYASNSKGEMMLISSETVIWLEQLRYTIEGYMLLAFALIVIAGFIKRRIGKRRGKQNATRTKKVNH